jgi:23S rRNA pseudouridine1911/1915/1917 synthase
LKAPEIIYEDRQLLVVEKPPGWLAQADGSERPDILEWARGHIASARGKPCRPFVGLCHRLDRQVGGLMVLAKTSKAASRISAQFRDREVRKLYSAICVGQPDNPMTMLAQTMLRDDCITRVARGKEPGTNCVLRYALGEIGAVGDVSACQLRIELLTGFKHQIRAQLASIGHPVYGDALYGAPGASSDRDGIALHSSYLGFAHPITGQVLEFTSQPDESWPWTEFRSEFACLADQAFAKVLAMRENARNGQAEDLDLEFPEY